MIEKPFVANWLLNNSEIAAGKVKLDSGPVQVNIDLTGECNINPPCVYCSGKNFGHRYPHQNVDWLAKYPRFLTECGQVNDDSFGEPLTHPGLVDLARLVTASGQVFSFVTNGLLLNQKTTHRLARCGKKLGMHVSVDAATADTYFKIKGQSFDRLLENLRRYVKRYRELNLGAEPDLTLTFVVMRLNLGEVRDFLRLASDLGVRALLAPLHDRPSVALADFGYRFEYEKEMLSHDELFDLGERAMQVAHGLGVRCLLQWDERHDTAVSTFSIAGVETRCLIPWRFLFIQEHRSRVFLCPYHKVPLGDLEHETPEVVWNCSEAQELRRSLLDGEVPEFCWRFSAACPLIYKIKNRGFEGLHEDSIVVGKNDHVHLDEDWHALESMPCHARWTRSRSVFHIKSSAGSRLFVECMVCRPGIEANPVRGHLEIAEKKIGDFVIDRVSWQKIGFDLPAVEGDSVVTGAIVVDDTWCPADVSESRDVRHLGIAVRRIWTA